MLNVETLEEGDVVYAATTFYNDGSLQVITTVVFRASRKTRCWLQPALVG